MNTVLTRVLHDAQIKLVFRLKTSFPFKLICVEQANGDAIPVRAAIKLFFS